MKTFLPMLGVVGLIWLVTLGACLNNDRVADSLDVGWGVKVREFNFKQARCFVVISSRAEEGPSISCIVDPDVNPDGGTP